MEAENGKLTNGATHTWLPLTHQSGYTGTSYLQTSLDIDALYQTNDITASSPVAEYPVTFTTPGTYTLWLRGYPPNAAGDSAYVGVGDEVVAVTGFAPGGWNWANVSLNSAGAVTVPVEASGLYTISLWMREDGLRIDRLLLTTDTNYIPTNFGPPETGLTTVQVSGPTIPLTRTIVYTYDNLYRLTEADYTSGEAYAYEYDPVGNRLQQIINGDTTSYSYDTANRIESVDGQSYTFDDNGNLLNTGVLTNVFDAANRLISTSRENTTIELIYNGVGNRVGQVTDGVTTTLVLDVVGLPEVIYTSDDEVYLHLPGVIVTEKAGEARYLLSDGLGSIRQATDDSGDVVVYNEFDPYGSPVENEGGEPYGYTGEWWEKDVELLHLRARWYLPQDGVFLSRDPVESEPPYQYVRGNPVNRVDPSGNIPIPSRHCVENKVCSIDLISVYVGFALLENHRHFAIVFHNYNEDIYTIDARPERKIFGLLPVGRIAVNGPFEDQNDPRVATPGRLLERGEWGAKSIRIAEGEDVCSKWKCIKEKMAYVDGSNIQYHTFGPNSNTAVYFTLKECQLPTYGPAYESLIQHEGWWMFNPPEMFPPYFAP